VPNSSTEAASYPNIPSTEPSWKLIARSDYILTGTLKLPTEEIQEMASYSTSWYFQISVDVQTTYKGNPTQDSFSFKAYFDAEKAGDILRLLDRRKDQVCILFVIERDARYTRGHYLTNGLGEESLRIAEPNFIEDVKNEIRHQQSILAEFEKSFKAEMMPHFKQVKKLISQMIDAETEHSAFRDLEKLGHDAVPAMILLMRDFRPLPITDIALKNPPDHWDGFRHHSPKTVVDALAAILNQITGESFGFIYSGGSERERQRTVDGWRIYLHYLMQTSERSIQ